MTEVDVQLLYYLNESENTLVEREEFDLSAVRKELEAFDQRKRQRMSACLK